MGLLAVSEAVVAPPERVFALATDLAGATERLSGIEAIETLTEGPMGVGTRWRETRQIMDGRSTETLEVTAFDPPRSYTAECEPCGCRYASTFSCEPPPEGTRARIDVSSQPLTLFARLMAPLGTLMAPGMRKLLAGDLVDLRRAAEAAE